ncbi:hypothetical protein GF412_05115 [Candidatus Micrarchaeota archaeon]|nr:hypothetical protein [Candidatus Micrarchaeota archaeon]MBD3418334.1 hypothetical protein [Candidatus Micrarchaeota archaeon]
MFLAVLSDSPETRKQFCKSIGKETGSGDITFYSSNFQGTIRTLLEPTLYPDKLQPLLYSLSIADYVVLLIEDLTPQAGEIIVALDSLKKEKGLILSNSALPLKGTVLENYESLSSQEEAKQKLLSLQPEWPKAESFSLVDSYFQVKSVGNVILGTVKSGSIKKRARLLHLPSKKEIEIKSIQLNDKDVEEVSAGGRYGICYKGDPIDRGILVSPSNSFTLSEKVPGSFSKSPFYKGELPKKIHAYSNLQFVEGSISGPGLLLDKPIAFKDSERLLIADPGSPKLRICGVFEAKR